MRLRRGSDKSPTNEVSLRSLPIGFWPLEVLVLFGRKLCAVARSITPMGAGIACVIWSAACTDVAATVMLLPKALLFQETRRCPSSMT